MKKRTGSASDTVAAVADFRLLDLIVRTAHVRRKDALRVIKALAVLSTEYQIGADDLLRVPMDASAPTLTQRRQCEAAYLGLYQSDEHSKLLFDIEQII